VLAEFTSAINEFAGVVGYATIALAVVYLAMKIGVTLLKRE